MKFNYQVSEEGVKKSIRDTFTNKHTFLTELVQNAQRAGATQVSIQHKEESGSLIIEDNGCGFDEESWKAFFTVYHSNWSEDIQAEQNPFGAGCAACYFAAFSIMIESNQHYVSFLSEDFLKGRDVEVKESHASYQGTRITLLLNEDVQMPSDDFKAMCESLFKGYTIPVFFNGDAIERPYALDNNVQYTYDFEFGKVILFPQSLEYGEHHSSFNAFRYYLQGYCVFENSNRVSNLDAVYHITSTKYRARVPDRSCLVNCDAALDKAVTKGYAGAVNAFLTEINNTIDDSIFVMLYFEAALRYAPELLLNKGVPARAFSYLDSLPRNTDRDDSCFADLVGSDYGLSVNFSDRVFTQNDFKGQFVVGDMPYLGGECSDFNPALFRALNYAYFTDILFYDSAALSENHWLNQHFIYLDESPQSSANIKILSDHLEVVGEGDGKVLRLMRVGIGIVTLIFVSASLSKVLKGLPLRVSNPQSSLMRCLLMVAASRFHRLPKVLISHMPACRKVICF